MVARGPARRRTVRLGEILEERSMKRVSIVSLSALAFAMTAAIAVGQGAPAGKPQEKPKAPPEQKAPAAAPQATEKATVIFLGNATCPGDGKAVNRDKFVDVEGQRIYVCSDECVAALKKDAAAAKAALAKAYPTATPVTGKCECGKPVDAAKAVDVTWQGHKISSCCASCAAAVKKDPVVTIVTIMHPDVKDAKNTTDPIDGKPVDPTIVGLYKNHLVHFSSWDSAAKFEKDPSATVAKLKLSS
jgi:hypothetical protein